MQVREAHRGKGSRNVSSPREFLAWKATNFPIFPGKLDYPPSSLPFLPFLWQRVDVRPTSLRQHKARSKVRSRSSFAATPRIEISSKFDRSINNHFIYQRLYIRRFSTRDSWFETFRYKLKTFSFLFSFPSTIKTTPAKDRPTGSPWTER